MTGKPSAKVSLMLAHTHAHTHKVLAAAGVASHIRFSIVFGLGRLLFLTTRWKSDIPHYILLL